MKLLNRCAVVTGGASGIGAAIAVAFAEEGADVALLDLDDTDANRVVERLRSTGRKAHFISCDVGDSAQVRAAFTQIDTLFGKVDILVNNAGIIRLSPILETSEAEWD